MNRMIRFSLFALLASLASLASLAQAQVTYVHTDLLGSTVIETDALGTVTRQVEHASFGLEVLGKVKSGPGFTGHYRDAETDLVYMQQRYYDPAAMRFISTDPVWVDTANGGNFNRYWYANNSPYTYVDPDGRQASERFVEQYRRDMAAGNGAIYEPMRVPAAVATAAMLVGPVAIAAGPSVTAAVLSNGPRIQQAGAIVAEVAAGDALGGASVAVAAAGLKLSGSGHEMFQSARSLIAGADASAADKVKAFDTLSSRITEETGGAWSATKSVGADGSTIYTGDQGGMMVIDPAGTVFSGRLSSETLPASQVPNYEKLRSN